MTQKTVYSQYLRMFLRMHTVNVIIDSTQQKQYTRNVIYRNPYYDINSPQTEFQ